MPKDLEPEELKKIKKKAETHNQLIYETRTTS
jgi:hypothetical protein